MSVSTNSKELAKLKLRQKICDDSPELRELRRQLQTAYNRRILETMILNNKADQLQERARDQHIAQQEEQLRMRDEMHLKLVEQQQQEVKCMVADLLKHQMMNKQQRRQQELALSIVDAKLLEERTLAEKAEEERIAAEMKLYRHRFREEQERIYKLRLALREEEKKQEADTDKQLLEESNRTSQADAQDVAERQKRIEAFEAVKERIASKLVEEERIKRETEELTIRLLCAQREEEERKREQEELRIHLQKRLASKQSFDLITSEKLQKEMEEKEVERTYSANLRKTLDLEKERQKKEEELCRSARVAVREDNYRLIQWKKERKKVERAEALAEDAAVVAEEAARCKVVEEEKLQLLRTIDRQLLNYLPKGCLTEEDLLNLNMRK